jgi:hypothetical protein
MQVTLCVDRGFQRLRGDASLLFTGFFGKDNRALNVFVFGF